MEHALERLTAHDAESIIHLSASFGWDYTSREVQVFLEAGKLFGHRTDRNLVSCAGMFPYGELASIGAVIVHPKYQGQGLGRALMQHCLDGLEDIPTILVSTEEGQRLYRSIGFVAVSFISKLVSDRPIHLPGDLADDDNIEPMTSADLDDVVHLDAVVIGASRQAFLKSRYPLLHGGVVFRGPDRVIQGYAMTACRNDLLIVGPVVALNLETAMAMVRYLTVGWQGRMRIDVPFSQEEMIDILVSQGFREEERPPVMLRNGTGLPGDRNRLFAIAAQAFG